MICEQTGREVRDELAELKAENKRMRDALELIASCDVVIDWDCPNVARRALVGTKP
jgi:hypothetical protein